MSERHRHTAFLIFGLILIAVTRAGYLGSRAMLDGDEAILGLMSGHLAEGRGLPLYFYGQGYGMAVVETLSVAVSFLISGASAASLKTGILVLWSAGWLFFVAAARISFGPGPAWIGGILLAVMPAWGVWATMGRGIYAGAFALTGFCLWQIARLGTKQDKTVAWSLLGFSLGILWLTNPVWLVCFSPFLLRLAFCNTLPRKWGLLIAGAVIAIAGIAVISSDGSSYWSPDLFGNPSPLISLGLLPERLLVSFSGLYQYDIPVMTGPFTTASSIAWSLVLLAGLGRLFLLLRRRTLPSIGEASLLAALVAPLVSLFMDPEMFGYRYLLPSAGFLVFFVAAEVAAAEAETRPGLVRRRATAALVIALGGLGLVSVTESSLLHHDERVAEITARARLLDDLSEAGVEGVYALDPALQWLIIFGSDETIPARWVDPGDRRLEYPQAVDRLLAEEKQIAIAGRTEEWERGFAILKRAEQPVPSLTSSTDRFLWTTGASRARLQHLGFVLNPETTRP